MIREASETFGLITKDNKFKGNNHLYKNINLFELNYDGAIMQKLC